MCTVRQCAYCWITILVAAKCDGRSAADAAGDWQARLEQLCSLSTKLQVLDLSGNSLIEGEEWGAASMRVTLAVQQSLVPYCLEQAQGLLSSATAFSNLAFVGLANLQIAFFLV